MDYNIPWNALHTGFIKNVVTNAPIIWYTRPDEPIWTCIFIHIIPFYNKIIRCVFRTCKYLNTITTIINFILNYINIMGLTSVNKSNAYSPSTTTNAIKQVILNVIFSFCREINGEKKNFCLVTNPRKKLKYRMFTEAES